MKKLAILIKASKPALHALETPGDFTKQEYLDVINDIASALTKCLACLEMDSDMQEDFKPEIALAKKAIKKQGKFEK